MSDRNTGRWWVLGTMLMGAILAGCSVHPVADGFALRWERPGFFPKTPVAKVQPGSIRHPLFAFPAVRQRPAGFAEDSAVYVFAGAAPPPLPSAFEGSTFPDLDEVPIAPIWEVISTGGNVTGE